MVQPLGRSYWGWRRQLIRKSEHWWRADESNEAIRFRLTDANREPLFTVLSKPIGVGDYACNFTSSSVSRERERQI